MSSLSLRCQRFLVSDKFPTLPAVAGWFIDRIGSRRLPFLLCLVFLAGATALLAVGTNIGLWITGRLLHGVSAGVLWVVCLALLSDTVGQAGIGQAVGIIGIPMSLGPIIGPLLGGVIYSNGGYHAVFGVMFALLAIDAFLRIVMIEKKTAQKWFATDDTLPDTAEVRPVPDPSVSLTPCLESFDTSYTINKNNGETINPTLPSRNVWNGRIPPRLKLLISFRMMVALTGGLLQSSLNVAFDSTLPLTVEALFGWNQTGQGLIFIAILIPSLLQPIFGRLTDKYQQGRRVLAAGGCLLATPVFVLLRLVTRDTLGQKALLCVLLVIIGLAMAIAMPAIIAEISATVTDAEKHDPQAIKGSVLATAWSLVNAAYAAGCMIGPLFSGLIRNACGWQTTTWCLGILSGVTGVYLLLCLGGWIGNIKPRAFAARE